MTSVPPRRSEYDDASPAAAPETVAPVRVSARGQRRSQQIVKAAAHLFQEAGYQNVSIDDIGSAIGLTGPAVYRHFKGKHAILVEALVGQVHEVKEIAARAAADGPGTSPRQRLAAFLDELGALVATRDEAMLWRRERRHLRPEEEEQFRAEYGDVLRHVRETLVAAAPADRSDLADLRATALLSMYANARDIRSGLSTPRLQELQGAVARAIVDVPLPTVALESPQLHEGRLPAGRRERVIEAAAALFDARGFYDVRIDDIAKRAGMSVATLYQHFESKTQILRAILERGAEGLLYVTAEALARTTGSREVLDVLIDTYVRQALGMHGRIMRILATDAIYLDPGDQEALRLTQREYVAEWIDAICALRSDLSTTDARALVHAAIGVITDLSQTGRVRSRPGIAEELRRLAQAIVLPDGLVVNR